MDSMPLFLWKFYAAAKLRIEQCKSQCVCGRGVFKRSIFEEKFIVFVVEIHTKKTSNAEKDFASTPLCDCEWKRSKCEEKRIKLNKMLESYQHFVMNFIRSSIEPIILSMSKN